MVGGIIWDGNICLKSGRTLSCQRGSREGWEERVKRKELCSHECTRSERVNTYYKKTGDEKEPRIIKWKKEDGKRGEGDESEGKFSFRNARGVLGVVGIRC